MINFWTNEEIDYIKNNYQNMTDKQISENLRTHSLSSVKSKRQELGFQKDKSHRKYSFQDVISEFSKTNYILLSDEIDYVDSATNSLRYLCPKHEDEGELTISLGHLQNGKGCPYCAKEKVINAHIKPISQFENECMVICQEKGFEYQGVKRIDGLVYIKYICPKHRNAGIQFMRKGNMNRENIVGCPYCFDTKKYKFSKGEKKVEEVLINNNISYLKQYTFDDCRDINMLPFDFYLPEYNCIIEYDGQHHFYPVRFNGVSEEQSIINHESTVKHDEIKNKYCFENNIKILRIPYFDFNNIESLIRDFLFTERIIA